MLPHEGEHLISLDVRPDQEQSSMYGLSPAIGILDITMGRLSKFKPQLPFTGHGGKAKTSSEGSHSEKESYAGPYDNSPIPRLTIHSFIMGVFVSSIDPFPL